MGDLLKVLTDDHIKVRRLFRQFGPRGSDYALARQICKEISIHAAIEEEILYPTLREMGNDDRADHSEEEHEEVKQLIAEVEDMEPDDRRLGRVMLMLQTKLGQHMDEEENEVFPLLDNNPEVDLLDLLREAFTVRQGLMSEMESGGPSSGVKAATANTGWGGNPRRRVGTANTGW